MNKMKNVRESINNRTEQAESTVRGQNFEITLSENKRKRMKRIKRNYMIYKFTIKNKQPRIIRVSEGEQKGKG